MASIKAFRLLGDDRVLRTVLCAKRLDRPLPWQPSFTSSAASWSMRTKRSANAERERHAAEPILEPIHCRHRLVYARSLHRIQSQMGRPRDDRWFPSIAAPIAGTSGRLCRFGIECQQCGSRHDRDVNAAKNIRTVMVRYFIRCFHNPHAVRTILKNIDSGDD